MIGLLKGFINTAGGNMKTAPRRKVVEWILNS